MAAALLAGCGTQHAGDGDTGATELGYARHAGAVEFAARDYGSTKGYVAPGQGLRQLVPLGDCALGVGTFANGYRYIPVNWNGSGDCTSFSITPQPGGAGGSDQEKPYSMRSGWAGGGLPADVAVPWPDGSVIGVGSRVTRRTPGGELVPLAELPLTFNAHPEHETDDDASVSAATRVGDRLLIGGGEYVSRVESPYVLASDDAGATVRRVPLPAAADGPAHTPVGGFAVHGTDVVAFGLDATNAYDYHTDAGTVPFWYSTDAGTHWTAGTVPATPRGTRVHSVLYASGRWYAVGGRAKAGDVYDSLPLVLTSTDGTHWSRADTAAMGTGEIVTAAVDGAGHPVLEGTTAQRRSRPGRRRRSAPRSGWVTARRRPRTGGAAASAAARTGRPPPSR